MERRLVIFLILAFGLFFGYSWLMQRLYPPRHRPLAVAQAEKAKPAPGEQKPALAQQKQRPQTTAEKSPPGKPAAKPEKAPPAIQAAPEPEAPEQWVTLGSASDTGPYRMLVTLASRGAALARVELSRYYDIDDRSGYLGHLTTDPAAPGAGCPVQVVGPGTPAADAKLKVGDVIKAVDGRAVWDRQSLEVLLRKNTNPGQTVQLSVVRAGKELTLSAKLRRRPLEVIKPEEDDPLSMLATLQQFDGQRLAGDEKALPEKEADKEAGKEPDAEEKERLHNAFIGRELDGVKLRTTNWKLVASDQTHAQFRRLLPEKGLEITKTYRLAKVPGDSLTDANYPAYHLEFEIEVRNLGKEPHTVAYRVDGPNGLPTEGKWYASRVTRSGGSGIRDFVASCGGRTPVMVGAAYISTGKIPPPWSEQDGTLTFIGIDAQYFSAVLMPQRANPNDVWFEDLLPIRVGKVDQQHPTLTNTSCRLIGRAQRLKPGGAITNRFKLFAGPKKTSILENDEYRLGELVYFGWPIFAGVAVLLTWVLHAFYAVVGNYGLAIILLTVFVRGCMFPVSRKQALGMKKMQELQPEIKKIQEKYKNNAEGRTKAQQELFQKHNYHPLSGCLPIFIQMPVFIGLWRTLSVAIELRDAPLLSPSIRWCSNLAAPDMLYDWSWFMPAYVSSGMQGIFSLGPYFNLLPIFGVILSSLQQKMFMPPPADEQAAMQQKVMQYMMIFMGVLFYKFASGLCIYFIVQSLWGFVERKFLPKTAPATASGETRAQAKAREKKLADAVAAREEAARAKKSRGKK